jgi:hypothetical protein
VHSHGAFFSERGKITMLNHRNKTLAFYFKNAADNKINAGVKENFQAA